MSGPREGWRRLWLRGWAVAWRPWQRRAGGCLPERPRILVVRPDHLGDVLFSGPALRLLRAVFPQAHMTALVGPWGEAAIRRVADLDEVLTCEFPGFTRQAKGSLLGPYRLLWREARRLRGFDLAVVLRFDHWWGAMLAYIARIPRRWGDDIAECRPFLTTAVPYAPGHHEVEQGLRLLQGACRVEGVPCPTVGSELRFAITEEEEAFAERYVAGSGGILVAIHAGAGAPVKLWPAERYAQVADALAGRWGARILLTGSRGELGLAWSVAAAMRAEAFVVAGETTVGQLAALFSRCVLVVGADSGPLHLAVAVGTPTVHLYGPVSPARFGPWAPGREAWHRVIVSPRGCVPCNRLDYAERELAEHSCMAEIATEAVLEAADELVRRAFARR